MAERRAEVAWTDPADAAPHVGTTSGLAYLRAVIAGDVPAMPILDALGIALVAADEGAVELRAQPGEMLYNQVGTVHGGFTSTLLDTACGLAGYSTQQAGLLYTTVDLSVRFLRPVRAGEVVRAVGTAIKPGRRVIATEARLLDADGRVLATGSSGLLVLPVAG